MNTPLLGEVTKEPVLEAQFVVDEMSAERDEFDALEFLADGPDCVVDAQLEVRRGVEHDENAHFLNIEVCIFLTNHHYLFL